MKLSRAEQETYDQTELTFKQLLPLDPNKVYFLLTDLALIFPKKEPNDDVLWSTTFTQVSILVKGLANRWSISGC